jgi:hypothetical protein
MATWRHDATCHIRKSPSPVDTSVVKVPPDIVYKGLPGAPQHVTLFGDSSQPGLYVDRIRFLPGMKVMPIGTLIRCGPSWSCPGRSTSRSANNGTRASSRPTLPGPCIRNRRGPALCMGQGRRGDPADHCDRSHQQRARRSKEAVRREEMIRSGGTTKSGML